MKYCFEPNCCARACYNYPTETKPIYCIGQIIKLTALINV